MLAVRLDIETEQRLSNLFVKTHRTKLFYVKQALLEYLDDLEDIYLAKKENNSSQIATRLFFYLR